MSEFISATIDELNTLNQIKQKCLVRQQNIQTKKKEEKARLAKEEKAAEEKAKVDAYAAKVVNFPTIKAEISDRQSTLALLIADMENNVVETKKQLDMYKTNLHSQREQYYILEQKLADACPDHISRGKKCCTCDCDISRNRYY